MPGFRRGMLLTAADLNARMREGSMGRLPIEWVETDYATELGGATLATDARKVIQYAWNLTAAAGTSCSLGTAGEYLLDSSQASAAEWPNGPAATGSNRGVLVVPEGLDFVAAPGAYFHATTTTRGTAGLVTTDRGDYTGHTRLSGARIAGGRWGKTGSSATTSEGNIFGLDFDDLEIDDVVVDGWLEGRAFNLTGDRHRLRRVHMQNPAGSTGCGGVRFWGGDDFWCDGATGTCGDDALQCVPTGNPAGFWAGRNISRVRYTDCTVTSSHAKAIVCGLPEEGSGSVPQAIAVSISDVRYAGCFLTSGSNGYAAAIKNENSSGVIRDVAVTGCVFDMTASSQEAGIEVFGAFGGVEDVVFRDCRLISPYRDVIDAKGKVRRLTLDNFQAEAPRTENASFRPMRFNGLDGVNIRGGHAHLMATAPGSPANALIDIGGTSSPDTYELDSYVTTCFNVNIGHGFEARNIRDGHFAVRATRVTGLSLDGLVLRKASGATSARAVTMANNFASAVRIDRSDFAEAGHTDPISDSNAVIQYGDANIGLRGPLQEIKNTTGSNEVVWPSARYVYLETSSTTFAITLNAPVLADRISGGLLIEMLVDGGFDVTMSLTNVTNLGGAFTTATWDAVGDFLYLVPRGSSWWLLSNNGVVLS
jgi:hypothetical protein